MDITQLIKSFENSFNGVDDNPTQSEEAINAAANFSRQMPNAEQNVATNNIAQTIPTASNIPPSAGSPMGTQIPDGNVPVSPEPANVQDPIAALKAQAAANMSAPQAPQNQQNPLDVLRQLASQQISNNAPGGSQSVNAMNNAQNALAPVNAAAAFGQNQMKGAGTTFGAVANPSSASDAAGFNGDFAKQGTQLQNNMNNVTSAMNTQLGAEMQQNLLGGGVGKNGVGGLFASLQTMTPDKQFPILMQMSMTPSLKPIADMLLQSPAMKAYTAQATAAGTEKGKASVGATVNNASVISTKNSIDENIQHARDLNKVTTSGGIVNKVIGGVSGLTQGAVGGEHEANIVDFQKTIANNLIPELSNMQNALANDESTNTPAIRQQMVKIIEEAKAIDVNEPPEARARALDVIQKSVNDMLAAANYKTKALGGETPPSMAPTAQSQASTTVNTGAVAMTLNGKIKMVPANQVEQAKAMGATQVGG
jgi:hypothetical protein